MQTDAIEMESWIPSDGITMSGPTYTTSSIDDVVYVGPDIVIPSLGIQLSISIASVCILACCCFVCFFS